MNNKIFKQIRNYFYQFHIAQAQNSKLQTICVSQIKQHDSILYKFLFPKERVMTAIELTNGQVSDFSCSCRDYQSINSCHHIPYIALNNIDEFEDNSEDYLKYKSHNILEIFAKNSGQGIVKKELNLEVTLDIYDSYWGREFTIKFKVGEDKLYSVGTKFNRFRETYQTGDEEFNFGKSFTYDPKKHYFNNQDTKILEFIFDNGEINYNEIRINKRDIKRFLTLLENKEFYIENIGLIKTIKKEMPIPIDLAKDNNYYNLKVSYNESFTNLTDDFEYIIYNKEVYKLDKDISKFLKTMLEQETKELIFEEKDLNVFSKGLLPIVKGNLRLSEELSNSDLFIKPDSKLYFDINKDNITCKIMLVYGNTEINYFDKTPNILRDIEYETDIINNLAKYGFKIVDNKIILEELDLIVNFLEEGINEIAEVYNTFTSEKLKNTKTLKKLMITSTFSIGQDNILSYNFDLGDINPNELAGIFSSLKQKKKYHKLKSGDIVSLEDKSLNELNDLVEDLDIDYKNGSGEIPKYRAIYLDSLKDKKYNIIKTDNLFNNFIEKFNNYYNNQLEFTKKEKEVLRPYQITGVEWLYNIHKCDLGGILADEMGLGKSIQTIYFFRKLLKEDKDAKFLIVCPTALVYNWLNEFKKFGQGIKVDVFVGNKSVRLDKIDNSEASVYITSYGTLREDSELYKDKHFKVCVIDEAQNIKNPLAKNTRVVKKIKADTKIALTGTPIENSIMELWSIFDFIMPGFLASSQKFNQKYKVKDMDEDADKLLSDLNMLISPFILRRRKIDVATDLPDKIENNIFIDLGESQRRLYAAEIKRVKEEMDKILATESFNKAKFLILQLLTKLRQLCIDPKLVFENYKGESAKIDNLIQVVKELIDNKHKILLFSSFKSAFDIIRPEFNKNNITYYTIDGSVSGKKRQELVDAFNRDDTNVFLITLKSGGTGLNLTSADVVIHLDLWWNPQAENQATDRAHRIGQTKNVEVIKLIATGTIEEKILDLQKKKQLLSDKLIEKNQNSTALYELTEKDIKNLLAFENKDQD